MERLLYSGLMFAAGMLSLWTALLLTATFIALAPGLRKSAPRAATISSTSSRGRQARAAKSSRPVRRRSPFAAAQFDSTQNGAEEFTPARSVSETLS